MKRNLMAGVALAAMVAGEAALAQSASDIIFVVDESGSMGGEHTFLQQFVPSVDANLAGQGITTRRYGLVGYGNGRTGQNQGVVIPVGGGNLGSAAQFATAAQGLRLSGATEDGYGGIDHAVRNIMVDPNASVIYVLVTDEDRDNRDASLSFASIQQQLAAVNSGATLTGILNTPITTAGGMSAFGTDGTSAFNVDANGNVVSTPVGTITNGGGGGSSVADYANLALSTPNGCVADLNQLRQGGATAAAFASVFANCLARAAVVTPMPANGPAFLRLFRDGPLVIVGTMNQLLGLRRYGLTHGADNRDPFTQGGERGKDLLYLFKTDRVAAFANIASGSGDLDATSNQDGADYTTTTVMAGVDVRVLESLLLGLFYANGDLDGSADSSTAGTEIDAHTFGAYMALTLGDNGYLDAAASYSSLDIDHKRPGFSGDTDGHAYGVTARGGYDFAVTPVLTAGPFARVSYTRSETGSFTETQAGGFAVGSVEGESLTGEIGARAAYRFAVAGADVIPHAEVAYQHEFIDDAQAVAIQRGAGAATNVILDDRDGGGLRTELGLAVSLKGGLAFDLGYNGEFGGEETYHGGYARLRIPF